MAEKRPKVGLRGTEGRAKAKPGSRKRQLEPVVVVEDDDDDEPFVPEPKAKKREPPRVELSGPVAKTKTLGLRRPRPARRNCFYSLVFSKMNFSEESLGWLSKPSAGHMQLK